VPVRLSSILAVLVLAAALAGCGRQAASGDLDGLLAEGWRSYSTGDFEYSAGLFHSVLEAPGVAEQQRFSALLGLATNYHMNSSPNLDRAGDYYTQLGQLNVEGAERLSLLALGKIDLAKGLRLEGRAKLTTLRRDYPESVEADEATLMLAQMFLSPRLDKAAAGGFMLPAEDDARRGLDALEGWLLERPDNSLAAVMHMMLGNEYVERQEYGKALAHLESALDIGIASARTRGSITWQIARIAERELKDYPRAEKYYALFVAGSRRHVLYYRAQESLERVKGLTAQPTE
jgi:tetratricopeptide (TPR) repeat protein